MPNAIKYSTTGDTLSLKKGNIFFGVGDVGKGPSSATTYYNGVTPPTSGYTIYSYNASQTSKLSFHSAADDAALRDYTNRVSGQSFATAAQCLNWYATQTDYVCVNRDYEGIVTSGLTFVIDAGFSPSYTTSGTTWYDLSYNGNNGTLTNGPTFNSDNGGSFVFDGIDDRVATNYSGSSFTNTTQIVWYKWNGVNQLKVLTYFGNSGSNGFGFLINDGTNSPNVGNRVSVLYGGSLYNAINNGTLYAQLISNQWTHLSITRDSTTTRLYQNGTFLGSTTSTPNSTSNYNFTYGAESVGAAGNVSIMSFYNRALSAAELLQNFNAQKSRFGL